MRKTILYIIITAIAAGAVFAAVSFNKAQMANKPQRPQPPKITTVPEVEVVQAQASSHQVMITGYGEVKSRYQLNLTAEVSGRVKSLNDSFATGQTLAKGATLAEIDTTAYRQALASANAALAQAKQALLEEKRQGEQSKQEWQSSGLKGNPDSPLVLREPQLASAQANYDLAKAEVAKAQQDLNNTKVTAPFEALVVERNIQPGSYVQVGGQIATLYSTDSVEIEVPLSSSDWNKLPDINTLKSSKWPVTLSDATTDLQWQGYIGRVEQHLESTTRQRSLVVVVDQPLKQTPALFPGSFVEVSLEGREIDSLWQLPASALSQDGEVWVVTQDNLLKPYLVSGQYQDENHVYIHPPTDASEGKVVVRPLTSYTNSLKVQPVTADEAKTAGSPSTSGPEGKMGPPGEAGKGPKGSEGLPGKEG